MQVFRLKIFHAIGIALLMLTCLAATPRDAAAQDAASFISQPGRSRAAGAAPVAA